MQKKRIARGDHNRKRKSRKCTLPSDYLTPAEMKRRNGEVKQYNLSRPMPFEEFQAMPEDLQAEYLRFLRARFAASDRKIAEMMGVSHPVIARYRETLGVTARAGTRLRPTEEQTMDWRKWSDRSSDRHEPDTDVPDETPAGSDAAPVLEANYAAQQTTPTHKAPRMLGGHFTIEGDAEHAAAQLADLFRGDPRLVRFTLDFAFLGAEQ